MAPEPLERIDLEGVHAYADHSVHAGEVITFRVSSDAPYKIEIVRLGPDMDKPSSGDTVVLDETSKPLEKSFEASVQPITPGSYVLIDQALTQEFQALTLECWVRPWGFKEFQAVLGQYNFDDQCGFALILDQDGGVDFYLGDGGGYDKSRLVESSTPLAEEQWSHIVGIWDGANASIWINGVQVASKALVGSVSSGPARLRLAAYGDTNPDTKQLKVRHLLDGDLAMPVIYSRALSEEEVGQRFNDRGLNPPASLQGVLACWPLNEERGSKIHDISGNERHGQIINGATWMIGGPSFNGKAVPRFGHYDPAQDTSRGHGLRFASDDLFDCGWKPTWTPKLPANLAPGIYVGRISYGKEVQYIYDVTFVVKKARDKPNAPILVLCSTNTWLAYNAAPFAKNYTGSAHGQQCLPSGPVDVPPDPPEEPRYNFYLNKQFKRPTYKVGLNVPWPVAAPYVIFSDPPKKGSSDSLDPPVLYSHLTRAERFLHCWLKENGYTFDVITDLDLHKNPSVLEGYEVVILNGHSEYWSVPAYQALERHLSRGKKNITLSGNTICWRVSFNEDFTAMECRKAQDTGHFAGGRESASFGECYHSDDGKRGGLMRECGYPAWSLIGLESVGFWSWGFLDSYVCEDPSHPFFKDAGLEGGATFATWAVGHEFDVCADRLQQCPPPSVKPANIKVLASCGVAKSTAPVYWDYRMKPIMPEGDFEHSDWKPSPEDKLSQMIHWERPAGGEVFAAGAIGAGMALYKDKERWGTVLRNVLLHFGVEPQTSPPPGESTS